ncbi:MAG: sigma-70 family RNA polymerase sigma factor [Kofleriaceae bacterium]
MTDVDWLATQFEQNRAHLERVAFRMLGRTAESEDAVQEAWIRLQKADAAEVTNLGGWLTTVVARVCLDMLRARKATDVKIERATNVVPIDVADPRRDIQLADAVSTALLVVLDSLAPVERVAFVLHDLFDLPFEQVAAIIGRSPMATRQLASRARRRVRGAATSDTPDPRREEIVVAFLKAGRDNDFGALLALLAPDAQFYADAVAVETAKHSKWGVNPLRAHESGAAAVVETFKGRAEGLDPALIDGSPGLAWFVKGDARSAVVFTIENGLIVEIEIVMAPEQVASLAIAAL